MFLSSFCTGAEYCKPCTLQNSRYISKSFISFPLLNTACNLHLLAFRKYYFAKDFILSLALKRSEREAAI